MATLRTVLAVAVSTLASLTVVRPAAADVAMDAYVADVVAHNPSLRARGLRRDAFRSEAAAADLWPDPTATVMLDNVPEREGGDMPMLRYEVAQMIPWPGKLGLMRDAIERQGDAAGSELEGRKLELVVEAKRTYLMLVLNERQRSVNAASQGLVSTIAHAALGRYGAGAGGHHEVARAQVEQSALEVEGLNLDGERASIVAMVNALRNAPPSTPFVARELTVTPQLSLSPARLAERALRQRPELAAMRAMQREEEAMGALARRERYPDFMTGVWYNQVLGGPDSAGLMLGVTLPVFNVTRQTRRADAADARAAGAGQDIAAMQAMIRFEVADAARKVDTATRMVELLRNVGVPRVRESFEASLAAYGTGTGDIAGLLDARRSLQSMELALARAEIEREIALAELERAVGGPLPRAVR